MDKPSLPKGTRDFGPAQMAKRQFILNNIRSVFQEYGFMPLETPAMENLSTLTGKYGDEGDQLLFKILNSGDYYEKLLEKILSPERITRINNFLFDGTKYLCRRLNEELTDDEVRQNLFKVISSVKKNYSDAFIHHALYLDEDEKQLLMQYFRERHFDLAIRLANLFSKANLYKDNFEANFEFHFNQFRDTDLQEGILPEVEKFLRSEILSEFSSKEATKDISEKGLRYDLTVPFARYVVMNRGELTMPFKRYQIQPVWRADRPQKGRYREFFQCDADVVGTDSLVNEAEIVLMIQEAFGLLGIKDFTIKINHRGVLSGLADLSGAQGNESALFVAIDKLDKIGNDKVKEELKEKGYSERSIDQVFEILQFTGTNQQKLELLKTKFQSSERGKKGVDELNTVFKTVSGFSAPTTNNQQLTTNNVELDISLARGLSYYTGTIFEVKVNNASMGSVCGGGRYDNLTQAFGSKEKLSGVGISFGIDRIYDVLEELDLFPTSAVQFTKALVVHMSEATMNYGLSVTQILRSNGISTEIYPDITKVKKQLDYANKKQIPFAVIIGEEEMSAGLIALKDLNSGNQEKMDVISLVKKLK